MTEIIVPKSFTLAPFFQKNSTVKVDLKGDFEEIIEIEPLIFDMLYEQKKFDSLKPWQDRDQYIPILLLKWKALEAPITSYFKARNREGALEPMKQMVKLYLAFLFWTNSVPVPELVKVKDSIESLKIKPVNVEERIGYILSVPNHHHAFTQLRELFVELQKKYAISKLK